MPNKRLRAIAKAKRQKRVRGMRRFRAMFNYTIKVDTSKINAAFKKFREKARGAMRSALKFQQTKMFKELQKREDERYAE